MVYYIDTREDQVLLYDHLTRTRDRYVPLEEEAFIGPNWYVTKYDWNDEVDGFMTLDEALEGLDKNMRLLNMS